MRGQRAVCEAGVCHNFLLQYDDGRTRIDDSKSIPNVPVCWSVSAAQRLRFPSF